MQELEKILEEINRRIDEYVDHDYVRGSGDVVKGLSIAKSIVRKYMNDGWIPAEEPPKKDYTTVFAVDKHDYYFVAVYDKEHGYRTNDVGADVDNIVAYCLFNPYRPERSDNHDGE